MKPILPFLLVALFLAGCGPKGLDRPLQTDTPEHAKTSMERAQKELSEDDFKHLQSAVMVAAMPHAFAFAFSGKESPDVTTLLRDVHGKTPRTLIEEAEARAAEIAADSKRRSERAREGRKNEIKTQLAAKQERLAEARVAVERYEAGQLELAALVISSPKLSFSDVGYLRSSVITFSITNKSKRTVKNIKFAAQYQTPGRDLPWAKGNFTEEFQGGLAPGENSEVVWPINSFTREWSASVLESKTDAQFAMVLINAEAADGSFFIPKQDAWGIAIDNDLSDLRAKVTTLEGEIAKLKTELSAN